MGDVTWASTDCSFSVDVNGKFWCGGEGACALHWDNDKLIPIKLTQTIDATHLREQCMELNSKRDPVHCYKVKYVMKYVYIEKNGVHNLTTDVVSFYELGYRGVTAEAVMDIVKRKCSFLQCGSEIRIHHVRQLQVILTRKGLVVGGDQNLVERYRTKCHPAVCVCNGHRGEGKLCHHWFMDTVLGGDRDVDSAHPLCIFSGNKIMYLHALIHNILTVIDDVVWGRMLTKRGLGVKIVDTTLARAQMGSTSRGRETYGKAEICINKAYRKPNMIAQILLHECAHARDMVDSPFVFGSDEHGTGWVHRMNNIQSNAAHRLQVHSTFKSARVATGRVDCQDCSLLKDTAHQQLRSCPECGSTNITITPYRNVRIKSPPSTCHDNKY